MEQELIELAGERCSSFEPGCPCCDAWETWDLHAYGALRADMDETLAFFCDGFDIVSNDPAHPSNRGFDGPGGAE